MPQRLVTTWIVLAAALLAVIGSGTFVVWKFARHVTVPCSGRLVAVPPEELGPDGLLSSNVDDASNMEIRWDEIPVKRLYGQPSYKDVRVVLTPADTDCACSDVAISSWPAYANPSSLQIFRDESTGLFVVRDAAGSSPAVVRDLAVFRRTGDRVVASNGTA